MSREDIKSILIRLVEDGYWTDTTGFEHALSQANEEIERLLTQEREKVREEACKFMCWGCERGHLIVKRPKGDSRLTHSDPNGWFECHATLFRQLDLTKDLAASSREEKKV